MAKARDSLRAIVAHLQEPPPGGSSSSTGAVEKEVFAQLLLRRKSLMDEHLAHRARVSALLDEYRKAIRAEQDASSFARLQEEFERCKDRVEVKKAKMARLEALARNVHARATYAAEVVYLHYQALDGDEAEVFRAVNDVAAQIRRTRQEWRLLKDKLDIKRQHQGQRKKDERELRIRQFDQMLRQPSGGAV
jgi:hypothetical protein